MSKKLSIDRNIVSKTKGIWNFIWKQFIFHFSVGKCNIILGDTFRKHNFDISFVCEATSTTQTNY